MGVMILKSLELKKPIFGKKKKEEAFTITLRKEKIRKDGREDYSDISELVRRPNKTDDISEKCNLTKGVVEDLRMYITRGLPEKQACDLSGVDFEVYGRWKKRYPLFKQFIDKCHAIAEADALRYIQNAMEGGTWQASAWMLERKWPSRYGRRDVTKHEVQYKFHEFINIVLEVINEADPEIRSTIVTRLRDKEIDIGDQG